MRIATLVGVWVSLVVVGCGGAANSGSVPPPTYVGPPPQAGGQVQQAPPPSQPGSAQIPPVPQQMPQILSRSERDGRGWPYGQSGSEQGIVIPTTSSDPTYGYTPTNPIRVGGFRDPSGAVSQNAQGSINQRQFLASLWGPNGEVIEYERLGGCCDFPTPHGIDGVGRVDVYMVTWAGRPVVAQPVLLYFDFYDTAPLQVPMGLTTRAPSGPSGPGWV